MEWLEFIYSMVWYEIIFLCIGVWLGVAVFGLIVVPWDKFDRWQKIGKYEENEEWKTCPINNGRSGMLLWPIYLILSGAELMWEAPGYINRWIYERPVEANTATHPIWLPWALFFGSLTILSGLIAAVVLRLI